MRESQRARMLRIAKEKKVRVYSESVFRDGVATISRLLKIIVLFCKRAPQKRLHSAKETYNFKEPTNRSHPRVYSESVFKKCVQRGRNGVFSYTNAYFVYKYVSLNIC